ncbi:MAG: hypothetical protein DRI61_09545 [Chloroflexi bacterium]|nr:MAG: hypothetical protein DRI61_09545 [Chloroflexota bacterium]
MLQERLEPFRRIRRELAKRPDYLWDILREGVRQATPIARATVEEAKAKMGLVSLRWKPLLCKGETPARKREKP